MGITRLADITGLDRIGLPVFVAVRPNSRSVATSQGKGLSANGARLAALMEAAESWHAERVEAPLRFARADDRPGRRVVVDGLPLRAGAAFDPARPILWLAGTSLRDGEPVWLPYELVHTDYRLPQPPSAGCFLIGTNGLAAGASRDEALRHAICELIERDALALWAQEGRRRRPVHPTSVANRDCAGVLDALAAADFAVAMVEITSDLAVPTWLAVIADRRDRSGHVGLGSACHPDRDRALLMALLEAVQVRTSYIAGARDDLDPEEFTEAGRLGKWRWVEPLLADEPCADLPVGPAAGYGDAGKDVELLLERLAARGLGEVVAVDLDQADIGIPVVRVLVPGLEGPCDDPAYTPGPRAIAVRRA
jgi:ribosomal protein S12 methylthiotransferase accessory factor